MTAKSEELLPLSLEILLENYFQGSLDENFLKKVAPRVKSLSQAFVSGRAGARNYMSSREELEAYILYYLPVNLIKIYLLLQKAPLERWQGKKTLSLFDGGCGPGTAALGALLALKSKGITPSSLRLTSFDRSREVLFENRRLTGLLVDGIFPDTSWDHRLVHKKASPSLLFPPDDETYDLLLFSNFFGELEQGTWEREVKTFTLQSLQPEGMVLFMEPAQKKYARSLLAFRDLLVQDSPLSLIAPCPPLKKCPALDDRGKEWCHGRSEWSRPPFIAFIDRLIGLRKEALKFSYFLLSKSDHDTTTWQKENWVVVSDPMVEKGKVTFFLCGREGRFRFELLKRDLSDNNRVFTQLLRGDEVTIEGEKARKERFRLNKESRISRWRGAHSAD